MTDAPWSPYGAVAGRLPADAADARLEAFAVGALYQVQGGVEAASAATGLAANQHIGAVSRGHGRRSIRLGPDLWLVIADAPVKLGAEAVEITETRTWLRLEGPDAPAILARLTAFDVATIAPDHAAQTRLGGQHTLIERVGAETYLLAFPTSVAAFMAELLLDAMAG